CYPRRKPALASMVTHSSLPVFVKLYRYLRRDKAQPRCLKHHFTGIFPRLRFQIDPIQRRAGKAAHSAVNIRISAMINAIQYPGRERCSEITVEAWHGPFFDAAAETASHHKFGAILKRLDEGRQ